MMQVCYDPVTGLIKFTVDGDEVPAGLGGDWISVPTQDLGELAAWRVVDGALEMYNLEPATLAFRLAVNEKRAAVMLAGTDVTVAGYGTVALQGRPEDQISVQGLAFGAQLRIAMGAGEIPMDFLDRNNTIHQLLPAQLLDVWQQGATFLSAIYARSWAIKEMDPLTTDINDPALWVV
jgi:hypothetical protein